MSEWTEEECRDQLCWCLDGKVSEYYALLVERNHDMAYKDLILKIEKRFGFRELSETAQVQFNNVRQTPEELLADWADRVLSLPTRAFGDLPENHMYQQEVVRFCQGAADKEAGSYASNIRPKTLKKPLTKCGGISITIRLFIGAVLGGIPRILQRWGSKCLRHRSEHWRGDESDERDGGGAVGTGEGNGEIKFNLAALSVQIAVMMEMVKKRGKGSPKGEKRVSFQENKEALNYKGATREA